METEELFEEDVGLEGGFNTYDEVETDEVERGWRGDDALRWWVTTCLPFTTTVEELAKEAF